MIHIRITRSDDGNISEIQTSFVSGESVKEFIDMVNGYLNCKPNASKDMKELGDMITHNRVTQDHTYQSRTPTHNQDYYTPEEQIIIKNYITDIGPDAWGVMLSQGIAQTKINQLLKR
jgi:hypothetical protein